MTPQELSVLRLIYCAPVAVGLCEPEMTALHGYGYAEQFIESVGFEDRPTWQITANGMVAVRANDCTACDAIERAARGICVLSGLDPDGRADPGAEPLWTHYRENAEQALNFKKRLYAAYPIRAKG